MKRKRTFLVLAIACILAVVTVVTMDRQEVGNEVGMVAEDFELPTYQGGQESFNQYEGQVVILNMWASWCEPCRDEMPDFMELQQDYHQEGLDIVTVNMQTYERTLNDAPEFIEEMNLTLPVFFDEDGVVSDRYGIRVLPTTFVIDREGVIAHVIPGEVNYERLEELIKPLL
ncbi:MULTISPECIES: TlpA disulfide reductase family protein [Alkalihalophilus]|uniref:TlpA disulfide reductase family protein n=1 Tax=Alkalihalophilus TaxID=2893060 RepID=UPI00259B6E3F|nr:MULTISPECIES: TlpA disulfide reductase family protein [Alkalihalophilus]MEC2070677.1 TlpA disulfide reductase family protein [Alkalihalophilus marmarensis]MED1601366.1 TlpA disulfide reductase family protein [Alkalihalophilus marmarensis]WEG18200.1 TlpA disulfide reductase family protein [Alkalihalophilus pseudofirmus]